MLLSQRPRLITSLVLLLAASAASPAAATAQKSNPKGSRPNILFIFSDDHATDAIITAALDPDAPFRQFVGGDAQLISSVKASMTFEEFEATMRATLDWYD